MVEVEINTKGVREIDLKRTTLTTNDGTQASGDVIVGADGTYSIVRSKSGGYLDEKDDSIVRIVQATIDKHRFNRPMNVPDSGGASQVVIASEYNGMQIIAVAWPDSSSYDVVSLRGLEEVEELGSGRSTGTGVSKQRADVLDMARTGVDKQQVSRTTPFFTHEGASWALVGRASASIVPFLGLDTSHAIEDAAALAVVLSNLASRNDIQDRLQLYRNIRHERATEAQDFSFKFSCGKTLADYGIKSFLSTFFSHNEYDHAVQQVRRYTWSLKPGLYWRMPIEFGPLPGPRQRHDGDPFTSQHSSFVSAIVRFKTERSLLQVLLPTDRSNYRFMSPGTIAYASFMQHTFSNLDWLGGGGYHLLGFYIHGVEHVGSNGEIPRGTYIPVLFESLADPILSGREELGMPKLFSSIDVYRRATSLRVNASWQGAVWGNFAWTALKEIDLPKEAPSTGTAEDGMFCYKYLPRVGNAPDQPADADHPILIPAVDKTCKPVIDRMWKAKDATIRLDKLDWQALPTMHHIIARLQELPILEVVDAQVVEGRGVSGAPGTQVIQR
ncbi:FAD-dependent monooxygenase ltmM [Pseudocercospora fuligena]|uniref:FAD-dependent monooxygenase ltmM n=1 Tax=Pseudocercospora fuligena TaxID=685502 RepID=A0A8H6RR04_9PEZI|nr:FAD-dependent monooxygenase ltmM [Pseudocercospora fuligena]